MAVKISLLTGGGEGDGREGGGKVGEMLPTVAYTKGGEMIRCGHRKITLATC